MSLDSDSLKNVAKHCGISENVAYIKKCDQNFGATMEDHFFLALGFWQSINFPRWLIGFP
jgi:hypothetical protein